MSKKSGSTSSAKAPLNPNTQTFNPQTIRWQSTYALQSLGPLPLPPTSAPPGLWTPIGAPITAGYGYGYPFGQQMTRFGPPPPVPPHSNYCCLANQRHQCGFDHNYNNGWPTTGSGNCWSNHRDDNQNTTNGVAITEVKDEAKDESDGDSSVDTIFETKEKTNHNKRVKELKESNEELKSCLEDTKKELKETQETLLKMKEQMSIDCLEYYRKNLKIYGDFIRQEVNRFYQNEEMAQKLKPIVEQISNASQHIKEEKERTRQSVLTTRREIKDNKRPDLSSKLFNPKSLPDFPDLLTFYKSILDEIPLKYLNDLSQLKQMANNFIPTKNKLANNGLPITPFFGDDPNPSRKPLPSHASNTLFSAPNIADLPKPDFNTLPMKPVMESTGLELNFPENLSPTPLHDSIIDNIDEPMTSTPLLDIIPNKSKDKPISPICKPLQPVIDLKAICAEKVKNNQLESTRMDLLSNRRSISQIPQESHLETDAIRPPMNPIPRFAKPKATLIETIAVQTPIMEAPKPNAVPNEAQQRLLRKLKDKYPNMSDTHLTDCIVQTKAVLIASGVPKGFTGMKVGDIINKISEYIDTKVLTNNFTKPRFNDMKGNIPDNSVMDRMTRTALAAKKAWNTLDKNAGKHDNSNCAICFEAISVINKYETECKHFFHHSCISNWIRKEGSCPICRRLVLPPGEFPEL